MSKFNFLVYLNAFSDANSSNNPSLSNFKWARDISGIIASNPLSEAFDLAPGESKSLFNGTRTLAQDGTTEYDISLKPLSTHTYILKASAGTLPNFRTPRAIATDATSQVTVTLNGPLTIFTFSGGTLPNLASVAVGDNVRIGSQFNVQNQGEWKILAKSSTSFTVENQIGAAEGPITLGASFADQIEIYSAAGVQAGDTLIISGGFSAVTQNSYKITAVAGNYLEFYSTDALPIENSIQTTAIAVYSAAKNLIYLESNQKVSITVNGSIVAKLEPFIINDAKQPGMFMLKSTVYSLDVQNTSLDTAALFLASIE